jgi:3-mercaptopyruvate sulfurtransferase SseA
MTRAGELFAYVAVIALLSAATLAQGRRHAELSRQVPLSPQALYRTLARSQVHWQIVDARTSDYDDAHVPGAIPFPGCDPDKTPPAARDHIVRSAPTVIVTGEGGTTEAEACLSRFTSARLLAGGMAAWDGANLPEDSGDYTPPSAKAGGGCL